MSKVQKALIAEYLVNIGVGWFAAGVIGVFISGTDNISQIIISITWGLVLSVGFLMAGLHILRK